MCGRQGARALDIVEGIVRDHRPATRSDMVGEAHQEGIEQAPPVGATGAPGREPAVNRDGLHRKMWEIGNDQIESATGHGPPKVAAVQLGHGAIAEIVEQARTDGNGVAFDVDATDTRRPHCRQRRQNNPAAAADLEHAGARDTPGIGAQGLNQRGRIFTRTQRRGHHGHNGNRDRPRVGQWNLCVRHRSQVPPQAALPFRWRPGRLESRPGSCDSVPGRR